MQVQNYGIRAAAPDDLDNARAVMLDTVYRDFGTGYVPRWRGVVLLTLGQMLVAPAARAWVPDLADDGWLGLYTGAMSSVSGLIVLIGSAGTGSLLDTGLPPAVPWLVLAAIPVAAITLLPRQPGPLQGRILVHRPVTVRR